MDIITCGRELIKRKLTFGTGGNVSIRKDGGFLITPSGVPYQELEEDDPVFMDLQGKVLKGHYPPSSEWDLHRQVYLRFSEAGGVVHTHSPYVNVLACSGLYLPAIHYLLACVGGDRVDLCPYYPYGTEELALGAVEHMHGKKAVLLANHGLVSWGRTVEEALEIAETVEYCSFLYVEATKLGRAQILSSEEMARTVERFKGYGPGKGTKKVRRD